MVRALINDPNVSMKAASTKPNYKTKGIPIVEAECFCLSLAIVNKDENTLTELWSIDEAYDFAHLEYVIDLLLKHHWS